MKRSIIFILSILLLLSVFSPIAIADESQYILITDNTTLYSDESCSTALCTLPSTYYAKLLETKTASYYVDFAGKQGYIVKTVNNIPTSNSLSVGTNYTDMVNKLKLTTIDGFMLFGSTPVNVPSGAEFQLIGSYDATYYVRYGELYGYCTTSISYDTTYELPALPTATATASAVASTGAEDTTPNSSNNVVRILLIIGICVPAVIIIYLLFKPNKSEGARYTSDLPKRNRNNDDDDFYQ